MTMIDVFDYRCPQHVVILTEAMQDSLLGPSTGNDALVRFVEAIIVFNSAAFLKVFLRDFTNMADLRNVIRKVFVYF